MNLNPAHIIRDRKPAKPRHDKETIERALRMRANNVHSKLVRSKLGLGRIELQNIYRDEDAKKRY